MKKDLIYSEQATLFGKKEIIGFGGYDWHIKEIDRKIANKVIIKNHYSKKVYNGTYINLGVFINNNMLGVLQFGYAMNPASAGGVVEGTEIDQYLELNRMWFDDKAERNSESRAISYSIKYIHSKFRRIKWIQSFADERCGGLGIVYQAANFGYYGEHESIFWELDGEVFHNRMMTTINDKTINMRRLQNNRDKATKHILRQFRYLYFIDKSWECKCRLTKQKYLKHYNND